jgi:hypothetical protein
MIDSGSWCADKSGLKEIELGAPVHLTFDELKLGDLGSHLAIVPGVCADNLNPGHSGDGVPRGRGAI